MARISWDKIAERYFEIGVSRGVFFLKLEKEVEEIGPYYEASKKVKSYIDYSMENGITGDPEPIPDEQGWVILDGEEDPDSGNVNPPSSNDDEEEEDEDISEYYPGVAWNGLSSVEIQPDGADPNAIWSGDVKYGDLRSPECLAGTISALSFPTQFRLCDGTGIPTDGLYIGQQTRREFGFCYRTELLSDMNPEHGYLLHVVYNCTVGPSEKEYVSVSESEDALLYTWEFKATPVELDGYLPFNEIVFDSTKIPEDKMRELEDCLYGTSETLSTLPSPKKLVGIISGEPYYPWDSGDLPYDTMKITENGIYDVQEYKHADVEIRGEDDELARKIIEGVKGITITNSASTVSAYAFQDYEGLRGAIFLNCKIIKKAAFSSCSALTVISFPVCTTIEAWAFEDCYSLATASFPACTAIEDGAFRHCRSLTTVSFPACTAIYDGVFGGCWALSTASFPLCTTIGYSAFANCSALTTVSFPLCTTIDYSAFQYCSALTSVSFPVCTTIGETAFGGCRSLTTASFPVCTTIGGGAFGGCTALKNVSFPVCTTIEGYAFNGCSALTSVSFSVCTTIEGGAFNQCLSLATISFPVCTTIGPYAFEVCRSLTTASFSVCTTIGREAFAYCYSLTTISFPSCTTIGAGAFAYCYSLTTISFPSCTTIGGGAFLSCYNLLSLYLLSTSVASLLSIDAFFSTPIFDYTTSTGGVYGSVFVRASLLTQYQDDPVWSRYADRLVGLTDEEIAALPS